MQDVPERSLEASNMKLDSTSTLAEIRRHEEAVRRYEILKDYLAGTISADVAMECWR